MQIEDAPFVVKNKNVNVDVHEHFFRNSQYVGGSEDVTTKNKYMRQTYSLCFEGCNEMLHNS